MKGLFGMFGMPESDGKLCSVDCDVLSCKHHGSGNCCTAESIKVASKSAQVRSETYCSTYAPKR